MTIREKIEIARSPEQVWPFIEDPEQRQRWNPKLKKIIPISTGHRHAGYQFRVIYLFSGREKSCLAQITEYDPSHRLTIELTDDQSLRPFRAREDYRLTATTGGTRVETIHSIEDTNVFLKLFVWLLLRMGKPVGDPYLVKLKHLVEES